MKITTLNNWFIAIIFGNYYLTSFLDFNYLDYDILGVSSGLIISVLGVFILIYFSDKRIKSLDIKLKDSFENSKVKEHLKFRYVKGLIVRFGYIPFVISLIFVEGLGYGNVGFVKTDLTLVLGVWYLILIYASYLGLAVSLEKEWKKINSK